MVDMTLIRPLNKGQGHSLWYQSISHIRLPVACQTDADFVCKIRRIRMRICRVIKITSYYGYCNSTYLLKIKQLQMN